MIVPTYTVLKDSDWSACLDDDDCNQLQEIVAKVNAFRQKRGRKPLECLVVEDDWPGYSLIEAIVQASAVFETPEDLEGHVVKLLSLKLVRGRNAIRDILLTDSIAPLPRREWVRRVKLAGDMI